MDFIQENVKGRFEPSLSLALTLNKEDVKRFYDFKEDSQEVKDYLSGLTLKGNNQKAMVLFLLMVIHFLSIKKVIIKLKIYILKDLDDEKIFRN